VEPERSLPHLQLSATCPYPSQLDPVHTPTSHFLKIHFNIILPSTPGSPQWCLSFRFPHRNPVHASPLPHKRYVSRPSHSSRFHDPHNGEWAVRHAVHYKYKIFNIQVSVKITVYSEFLRNTWTHFGQNVYLLVLRHVIHIFTAVLKAYGSDRASSAVSRSTSVLDCHRVIILTTKWLRVHDRRRK
jgi:hypothetical protein